MKVTQTWYAASMCTAHSGCPETEQNNFVSQARDKVGMKVTDRVCVLNASSVTNLLRLTMSES